MPDIQRSALLPYSSEQVYELINDVSAYPNYLEGCVGVDIIEHSDSVMEARLDLAKAGIKHSFTTRNQLYPPNKVIMELVDGPFEQFAGAWTVTPLSEHACKISLSLSFTLNNKVLAMATKTLFNPIADNLVNAVVKRAGELYQ